MSKEENEVQYTLTVNTAMAYGDIRKLEIVMIRLLSYIKKFTGGNEQISVAINWFQKLIIVMKSAMQMARAVDAATGPIGWALAITSVMTTAFTVSDFMYDTNRALS